LTSEKQILTIFWRIQINDWHNVLNDFLENPMNEDVYIKLRKRLNHNSKRFPAIDEVFDFLKAVFTAEQAELASQFPVGAHSLKNLSKELNRDENALEKRLESMADEGQIFVSLTDKGRKEYSLIPLVPGLIEFQSMKGNAQTIRLASRMGQAVDKLAEPLFQNPEDANNKIGSPGLRTLAVEELLPTDTTIADWEQITRLLEMDDSFAVGKCACREMEAVDGNPCKIENVAMEACIYFGNVADYMIDRGFAKRYSKVAVLELLKTCEQQGLVHNINNFLGLNHVLCNCCGCCCHILGPMLKHRGLSLIANSNFMSVVDRDSCSGCGDCEEICQLGAIFMTDDIAEVIQNYCIGCGNCVSVCSTESLSLTRCSDLEPPAKPKSLVGLGV
jgi:NAD-dependent dihydropyrimidine dehydrogenase PreA subunit